MRAGGERVEGEGGASGAGLSSGEAARGVEEVRDQRCAQVGGPCRLVVGCGGVADGHGHAAPDRLSDDLRRSGQLGREGQDAERAIARIEPAGEVSRRRLTEEKAVVGAGAVGGEEGALHVHAQRLGSSRGPCTGRRCGCQGSVRHVVRAREERGEEAGAAELRQGRGHGVDCFRRWLLGEQDARRAVDLEVDEAGGR